MSWHFDDDNLPAEMYVFHISITVPNFSLLSSLTRTFRVDSKARDVTIAEELFSHTLSNRGSEPAIRGSYLCEGCEEGVGT
jgi:hypothetical protein